MISRPRRPNLSWKAAEKGEPEVTERECKVLVEEILEELAHANVRPSAVNEQQPFEEAKLSQRVVARHHRLHAFLTTDAHTDMSHCVAHTRTHTHTRLTRWKQVSSFYLQIRFRRFSTINVLRWHRHYTNIENIYLYKTKQEDKHVTWTVTQSIMIRYEYCYWKYSDATKGALVGLDSVLFFIASMYFFSLLAFGYLLWYLWRYLVFYIVCSLYMSFADYASTIATKTCHVCQLPVPTYSSSRVLTPAPSR